MYGVKSESIVKANGALETLCNFDPQVQAKEFVVPIGQSSSGKSTALRVHAGLKEISSGQLAIDTHIANPVAPTNRDIAMALPNPIFVVDDGGIEEIKVVNAKIGFARCLSAGTLIPNPPIQSITASQRR